MQSKAKLGVIIISYSLNLYGHINPQVDSLGWSERTGREEEGAEDPAASLKKQTNTETLRNVRNGSFPPAVL